MQKIIIPQKFLDRYEDLAPKGFQEIVTTPLERSFRVNTLKANRTQIQKKFKEYGINLKQCEWYKDAFTADTAKIIGTPEHFLGQIYVQELVSMIPILAAEKEIKAATLILDGCAAPGSKTTQIAALNQKGLIVANELEYTRIRALKHNTEKTGCLNIQTTNLNFLRLPNDYEYDVILLDAPCSGEGTCRKNPKIFLSWKEKDYKSYSGIQKQLIMKAYNLLKEGGTLIYSTCTFAPEENERVINHLLENTTAKIQEIKIKNLKSREGITEWMGETYSPEVKKAMRIWPQDNDTGGFFISKFTK
jgi:tRNA (cytosine49-C5)-methyltransferase